MPSVSLKDYQRECLGRLEAYCREVRAEAARGSGRPERDAFEAVTGRRDAYLVADAFAGVPYVCLRVPTGGGKTLLGAHAVGTLSRHLGLEDQPLVFWVTPTTVIRDQTLRTFRDRNHPNHAALADSLGPSFQVLTLEDAQSMSKAMLIADPVVIVTTIQSYRIDQVGGRKVYQDNGYLMDHFQNLPAWSRSLLDAGDGNISLSLANAMKLRRPIVVIDEAHNARTKTSFESLIRFGPLAVLELTATPQREHDPINDKFASNVLHAVTALELQQEGMIKLPVELESRSDWLDVLKLAIDRRKELAVIADKLFAQTGRRIRPIALIQAQPNSQRRESHTASAVKAKMIDPAGPFKLAPASVAICTGAIDELAANNVDLSEADCPVEYVITVDKLTEGWDCPFAYVLGSIGNVATETAVEQILGRVLRMPQATPTGIPALDRAYAVVQSPDVLQTANSLRDALVKHCGFDTASVQDALRITRVAGPQRSLALSSLSLAAPPRLRDLPDSLRAKLDYSPSDGVLRIHAPLSFEETRQVRSTVASLIDQEAVDDYWNHERSPGIAIKHLEAYAKPIRIPQLTVVTPSRRSLFEPRELEEYSWNLDACDPTLDATAFDATYEVGAHTSIALDDAGGTRVGLVERIRVPRVWLFDDGEPWSELDLICWLNRELHKDARFMGITATESAAWLKRVVTYLMTVRSVDLGVMVRKRHALADAVIPRIAEHGVDQVRKVAELLFRDTAAAKVETSFDLPFDLTEQTYRPYKEFLDPREFTKHAFEKIAQMNGEERVCAKYIDSSPHVGRWVRNLEREAAGGWSLPLSPGRFFPDFIAELTDGRLAAIEYKGADRAMNPDQLHKKCVGELWARQSNGKAAFVWVVGQEWQALASALAPAGKD
jgi:type III restriction enzyme